MPWMYLYWLLVILCGIVMSVPRRTIHTTLPVAPTIVCSRICKALKGTLKGCVAGAFYSPTPSGGGVSCNPTSTI